MARHEYCEPGKQGLTVKVYDNNIEKAIKIFKKKVMTDGILRDYRTRQSFERPGEVRRRKKAEAQRRWHKYLIQRKETEGF